MSKIKLAIEIAQFVLFLIQAVKTLVLQAEEQLPEPGRGSEKFAWVKEAVVTAAQIAGFASDAVTAVDQVIDAKINQTVDADINGN